MTDVSDPPQGVPAEPERRLEVLGAFTAGAWQSLVHSADAPDDVKAATTLASGALGEELGLIVGAETLIVLAGSGTSRDLAQQDAKAREAPTMADLWTAVAGLGEFAAVKGKLDGKLIDTENLEHVLSDAQARQALSPADGDLKTFVTAAEGIVLDRCSFVTDGTDVGSHEIFLRKVARRSTRLQRTQVFTTNYDLAFETAAQRSRFNVIDGFGYAGHDFDGGSFDLDYVRRRPNEQLTLEPSVFHFLKLHGSVDWNAEGDTVRKVCEKPKSPVLIYPSAAKYQLSYQQPYLEFMSRFQIALRQPDVGLVVVGYGFNDDHLNAPIEAAIRSNVGLRAAVVTPSARAEDRADSIEWVEDLIVRGDRRLTMLTGTFKELVQLLPDIPPQEERDAHAERVSQRRGSDKR